MCAFQVLLEEGRWQLRKKRGLHNNYTRNGLLPDFKKPCLLSSCQKDVRGCRERCCRPSCPPGSVPIWPHSFPAPSAQSNAIFSHSSAPYLNQCPWAWGSSNEPTAVKGLDLDQPPPPTLPTLQGCGGGGYSKGMLLTPH